MNNWKTMTLMVKKNDTKLVLELLEFSTTPLLNMTEVIQKDIEFYRRTVKMNGMSIARNVFDVLDSEVILEAITHTKCSRFLNCSWRNDEEIASRATQLYPAIVFFTNYKCYNLRNRMVKEN